ncbi:MAG: hypothetical protein V4736_05350, partial [Bdellovibrionota bacterium]
QSTRLLSKNDRVFFLGAAIMLKLQRDRSEITIQVMNHLNPFVYPQVRTESNRVKVQGMAIPVPDPQSTLRPAMLITYSQRYNRLINTEVDFEFGSVGAMESVGPRRGFFQIQHELSCYRRSSMVPSIMGTFGPRATKNSLVNLIAKNGKFSMDFYSLRFDLSEKVITSGDIRVSAPGLLQQCYTEPTVTQDILGELNANIDGAMADIEQRTSLDSVLDLFLTNLKLDLR